MTTTTYPSSGRLTAVDLNDFLEMDLPERGLLLGPWLPKQGLAMIYAPRGLGKTFFGLSVAMAVATGSEFLGWKAPQRARVLYLDGEMPANVMQDRLTAIRRMFGKTADPGSFFILNPDLVREYSKKGMPNLASSDGREQLEDLVAVADLIVVDNISTLCGGEDENDSRSWHPVQEWALNLRSAGKTVLFVHHAAKKGQQRGTSKREDVLDTVIALRESQTSSSQDGAAFEVHFEKNRGFCGADAAPMDAQLVTEGKGLKWSWRTLVDGRTTQILSLKNEGLSQTEIAERLAIDKSTVSRRLKAAGMREI